MSNRSLSSIFQVVRKAPEELMYLLCMRLSCCCNFRGVIKNN